MISRYSWETAHGLQTKCMTQSFRKEPLIRSFSRILPRFIALPTQRKQEESRKAATKDSPVALFTESPWYMQHEPGKHPITMQLYISVWHLNKLWLHSVIIQNLISCLRLYDIKKPSKYLITKKFHPVNFADCFNLNLYGAS